MPRTCPRPSSERGFGLVELLVVVAILGVLVLVAIPVFGAVQSNAKDEAVQSALKSAGMQLEVRQETAPRPIHFARDATATKLNMGPRTNYLSHVQNYGLLCGNNAGDFAIYAVSATGNVFYYSSVTKAIGQHTTAWPVSGGVACPAAGVPSDGVWRWANHSSGVTNGLWPIH